MRKAAAIVGLLLAGVARNSAWGGEKWTRLTTPHFELYTSAGEKKGRDTVLYFEEVRSFFGQIAANKNLFDKPVRIVLFRSEAQFKPYAPNEVAAAYYAPGPYRDYIVMGDADPEHLQIAIHEFMHLVIDHGKLKLPLWLNEGLADVYSTLKPMGKKTMIGDLIPGHLATMRNRKWLTLEQLTQVNHESPDYNERKRAGIFYAESWALTHMLFLSPDYQAKFAQFLAAVSAGKTANDALQETYGKPPGKVYSDLQIYFQRNHLYGATFNVSLSKSEEDAETSAVESADSELVLADLLAASGKLSQAAEAYRNLRTQRPHNPEISRAMGYLAWQGNDQAGAMKEFEASFSDGSKDPQMCFNLAMLELSRDGRSKVAFDALQRALEVKPEYAEARIQLGLARLNAEQYGAALNTLSALKHVEPDKAATVFNALAFSCLKMGALEEARKNALQAQKWDRTDAETQQTREILSYLDTMERQTKARIEHPVAVSGERPAAPTRLESETSVPLYVPETIDLIEGTAKNIDCAKKRFVIDAGGKSMAFDMSDTARISVHHAGAGATFDFTCGAQKPFHVTVGYIAGAAKDVVGVLRSLQF